MEVKKRENLIINNKNQNNMNKVHAWWLLCKQDAKAFEGSATVKEDIATLKKAIEGMLPDLFNQLEADFAKILLAAL